MTQVGFCPATPVVESTAGLKTDASLYMAAAAAVAEEEELVVCVAMCVQGCLLPGHGGCSALKE